VGLGIGNVVVVVVVVVVVESVDVVSSVEMDQWMEWK